MKYRQVETLLSEFPRFFETATNRRSSILYGGGSRVPFSGGSRRSGHGDPTANKALELVDLRGIIRLLVIVRKWLDTELESEDRQILIEVWRHSSWETVARRCKREVLQCQSHWKQMVASLRLYVGRAFGPVGVAFACGHVLRREGLSLS